MHCFDRQSESAVKVALTGLDLDPCQIATRQALSPELVHEEAIFNYPDFSVVTSVRAPDLTLLCGDGGLVPSVMVGLLAAIATAMPALIPYAHGYLILVIILEAAAAAGLAAICASPDQDVLAVEAAGSGQKKIF